MVESGGWGDALSACESDTLICDGLIKGLPSGAGDAVARMQGRLIMVIRFAMGVVCSGVT